MCVDAGGVRWSNRPHNNDDDARDISEFGRSICEISCNWQWLGLFVVSRHAVCVCVYVHVSLPGVLQIIFALRRGREEAVCHYNPAARKKDFAILNFCSSARSSYA